MRWRGILFWNFSVFQVSKSIKSGAWWPIVWRFCENYFSQKVHCDIRFIPKSTVQLSDKSRKIQTHQKQSQFWKYIYLLIFVFWPKNVLLRIQETHDTYWTALGWDIVWKIHQQHNGDFKTFLVLNPDQLVKSQALFRACSLVAVSSLSDHKIQIRSKSMLDVFRTFRNFNFVDCTYVQLQSCNANAMVHLNWPHRYFLCISCRFLAPTGALEEGMLSVRPSVRPCVRASLSSNNEF